MNCLFSHSPHKGLSSKWELKVYTTRTIYCPEGWVERKLVRSHICRKCGVHYSEIKEVDDVVYASLSKQKEENPK